MFNKEGIPFFIISIPFLSILLIAFFGTSYYLKVSSQNLKSDIELHKQYQTKVEDKEIQSIIDKRTTLQEQRDKEFINFILVLTICVLLFMVLFTMLMTTIINDVVKKYVNQVKQKEEKLQNLNENLAFKVKQGIEEGKRKDKAILRQAKLARMGTMISMIAHQWRQPLSELSGILMELETATRFKKVDDKHILKSIDRSNDMIEFMSNTIDDFRNFYKPDKLKESFDVSKACIKAISIVDATLHQLGIELSLDIKDDKNIYGYKTEYSQVILNIITNAKDILNERSIKDPKIDIVVEAKGLQSIVTIKDNGGGIDEKNFESIFDPYYSTKDSSKGTGLGLYISKLIIEKNMGGELSVENDENGAVFRIIIMGMKNG